MHTSSKSKGLTFTQSASLLLLACALGGCASSTPAAKFSQPIAPDARVIASDTVRAKVAAAPGVAILSHERERIAQQILAEVRAAAASGPRAARSYEIDVTLTRYDKGNAFARMMMAGLGQIHMDGQVSVYRMPGRSKVAEFTAKKTFTWGGAYGGSVSIEGIEKTFAQIVANAVCQKR